MMYKLSGEVVHGEKKARLLGYPTANIPYDGDLLAGVYAIRVEFAQELYDGIGVLLEGKGIFEAHLIGQDIDLYEKEISVYIMGFVRENVTFISPELLKKQIASDISEIKKTSFLVLTFGSFDLVHEGHKYYLSEAKKYGTSLITIVASDENIKKIKGFYPSYPQIERISHILDLGIATEVICGSQNSPLQWIDIYSPSSICLGYDQRGPFVDMLEDHLRKNSLSTQVIRISPHQPEIYKSSLLKERIDSNLPITGRVSTQKI